MSARQIRKTAAPSVETAFITYQKEGETVRLGLVSEFDKRMQDALRKENKGETAAPVTIAEELSLALADVAMGQIRLNNIVRRLANLCLGSTEQIRANGLDLTIEVAKILRDKATQSRVASRTNTAIIKALKNLGIVVKVNRAGDWTASACNHLTLKDSTGRVTNYGRGGIDIFYPKNTSLEYNNESFEEKQNTIEAKYIEKVQAALAKVEGNTPEAEADKAEADKAEADKAEADKAEADKAEVIPRYYNPKFNKLSNGIKSILKQLDKEVVGASESEIKAKRIEKDSILKYKSDLETLMNKIKEEIETATQANTVTK